MLDFIVLILASLMVIGTLLIFIFRDVLHVAVALSILFFVNSLVFLLLDQPLLAVIQLLIMIGGVSVYLFVGVAAASYSNFKYTNYVALAVTAVVIFLVMLYGLYSSDTVSSIHGLPLANQFSSPQIISSLTSRYTIASLYAITIMLFLVAIASIPLLKDLRVK